MKNYLKIVVCALVLMCSTNAMAQREGLNEAGVNFGFMTGSNSVSNVGIGIKYGYMASDNLRFEASGMYYFKSGDAAYATVADILADEDALTGKSTGWFDINLNAHYLFNVAENTSIYPIFGFTTMFGKTSIDLEDFGDLSVGSKKNEYTDNHFRFGVNLGFGGQYDITDDFAVTLEAKYKLIKDFGNFNVALGCVVLF